MFGRLGDGEGALDVVFEAEAGLDRFAVVARLDAGADVVELGREAVEDRLDVF